MTRIMGIAAAVSAAALLAACSSTDAEMAPTSSNAFNQALGTGYAELSANELAEYDYRASRHFAEKSVAAGSDAGVEPDALESRKIPAEYQDEMGAARTRLLSAYGRGATDAAPVEVANAQIMFDSWLQEREENHQVNDIDNAKAGFEQSMAQVDSILLGSAAGGPYNVFFDLGNSELSGDAGALLATILGDIAKRPDAKVVVSGHADTSGSADFNLALSQERADAVAAYLVANGVPESAITKVAAGQNDLLVPTEDGVQNAQNRRALIIAE